MLLQPDDSAEQLIAVRHLPALLFNHADAWVLTGIISLLALTLHGASLAAAWPIPAMLALYYGFGFAVNDYYDAAVDARDPRKARRNFFVQAQLPRGGLLLVMAALLGLGLAFVAAVGWRGLLVVAVGLAAIWLYSAPPLRFKSRPGFDLLMHMVFVETFPYAATLFLLGVTPQGLDYGLLACFLLGSLGAQLEQQIRDHDNDLRFERTFTTTLGIATAARLLRLASALLIALGVGLIAAGIVPGPFVPFALLTVPVLVHRFVRPADAPRSEALVRWMVILAAGYALWLWAR